MRQIARNLTDGFLNGKKYLIMDRDTKYTPSFCAARPTCPLWFRDSTSLSTKNGKVILADRQGASYNGL